MTAKGLEVLRALNALSQNEQVEIMTRALAQPRRSDAAVAAEPLREHFLIAHARDGLTAVQVALACGWLYGQPTNGGRLRGDSTRVLRRLGLAAQCGRRGNYTVTRHMTYECAVALAQAMDVDYHKVGV